MELLCDFEFNLRKTTMLRRRHVILEDRRRKMSGFAEWHALMKATSKQKRTRREQYAVSLDLKFVRN